MGKDKRGVYRPFAGNSWSNNAYGRLPPLSERRPKLQPQPTARKPRQEIQCYLCHAKFESHQQLHKHKEKRHPIQCRKCHLKLKTMAQLHDHLEQEHPLPMLECRDCSETFDSWGPLHEHRKEVHPPFKFTCQNCRIRFRREAELHAHRRTAHPRPRPVCRDCGREFRSHSLLSVHRGEAHAPLPWACGFCNQTFASPERLYAHRRQSHAVANIAKRTEHKETVLESPNDKARGAGAELNRRFMHLLRLTNAACQACGYTANNNLDLWVHELEVHQSSTCKLCGVDYNQVLVHVRVRHCDVCPYCQQASSSITSLLRHISCCDKSKG